MTNLARVILEQLRVNPSLDAEQLLSVGIGNSTMEVDFIIEQLKAKSYL